MKNPMCMLVVIVVILQGLNSINCNLNGDSHGMNVIPAASRSNSYVRDTRESLQNHQRPTNQPPQHYVHNQVQSLGNPANGMHVDHKNSYNLLSEAMTQAVSNEFSSMGGSGSADGACQADDMECYNAQDRLSMEAIRALHKQLDDDDNGNIDLSESDDFLREELKYDSGYEKRQKAFHFNDDMHISVKELWEAWLRSEVHNWTIEQTTDWLAQSVQLPQYVEVFKLHKVTGAALPRLAVNTMHYLSNVLGIKDPIHKQKIALKAMDVVLFGPPRETGTRWKDYILVTLLLSAIIGCWYAYQQSKNAKLHLRRMAQDMEGLQRAEQSLQEMQKELERARMEQENVASEKMDLERRLKEAPSLSTTNSDLEVQQLKKEIEMLRSELSRAEIELVDNCWSPPPQLQQWLQYTYELENKNHQKKRVSAEKQLQGAREACEKLRKKRSSFVGAFVSTHGKSIDDVDRSIVEARNALSEVTNELQERLHRWKQIETCLGFNIVNNNGFQYLENVLYGRNGTSSKGSRGRITSSTDDLDEDSIQGLFDSYSRSSGLSSSGIVNSGSNALKDDSSCSDEGADVQSVHFYLGSTPSTPSIMPVPQISTTRPPTGILQENCFNHIPVSHTPNSLSAVIPNTIIASHCNHENKHGDQVNNRDSSSVSECSVIAPPRLKKQAQINNTTHHSIKYSSLGRAPLPPPRKSNQNPLLRSQSTDMIRVPLEMQTYFPKVQMQKLKSDAHQSLTLSAGTPSSVAALQQSNFLSTATGSGTAFPANMGAVSLGRIGRNVMVKQFSTTSQQSSSSSTSSSVQSAPSNMEKHNVNIKDRVITEPPDVLVRKTSLKELCSFDKSNINKAKLGPSNERSIVESGIDKSTFLSHTKSSSSISEKDFIVDNNVFNSTECEPKKRKRRLRFPFGGGHNSSRNKHLPSNSTIKDFILNNKKEIS